MLNAQNASQKKRQGVGASCSLFLCQLHPTKLVISRIKSRRFNRREKIHILMKNDEFEDSVLQCVQMWVKVDT